ncbi:MAG: energy-coupling factor transporter ATPase [Oscillospiraceae bacterium]|nr:energy-coupling factor transporter ATPase [Oscillospiraceae bacterium]
MPILQAEHLSYTYGAGTPFERQALDDVSLSLEEGEFLGIIGHTGSGKSTLAQHLNGLLRPTAGRVLFRGRDIWANPRDARKIRFSVGLVFQYPEYQLFEETVARDIAFGPRNMGVPDAEIGERVAQSMALAGLSSDLADKSPFELSGGQRRRAAIAGVIAMAPDVLVLDEPTAGLDPQGRREILDHIRLYHETRGSAVVLVSHNMEDIARYASRIAVLKRARLWMEGAPRDIFSRAGELEEAGLSPPPVTRVMQALRDKGLPVDTSVYAIEPAAQEILRMRG